MQSAKNKPIKKMLDRPSSICHTVTAICQLLVVSNQETRAYKNSKVPNLKNQGKYWILEFPFSFANITLYLISFKHYTPYLYYLDDHKSQLMQSINGAASRRFISILIKWEVRIYLKMIQTKSTSNGIPLGVFMR